MLYRFIVDNLASFADSVEFNMFPNPKRETLSDHVYNHGLTPILKLGAVFGANGSGKSNLVHSFKFLKRVATSFDLRDNKKYNLGRFWSDNRYMLPVAEDNKPISLLIEFESDHRLYRYDFSIDGNGLSDERLLCKDGVLSADYKLLYEYRDGTFNAPGLSLSHEIYDLVARQLAENRSCSAMAVMGRLKLGGDLLKSAFRWIKDGLDIITTENSIPILIDLLAENPEVERFTSSVIEAIGLGIDHLKVKESDFDEWVSSADSDIRSMTDNIIKQHQISGDASWRIDMASRNFPRYSLSSKNGRQIVRELLFCQSGIDGYVGELSSEYQSDGTLRLLLLLPAIYDAIENGKTVVIDEIENSIHPLLIRRLIKFFGDSKSTGQLIFTSHETILQNQQQLLRPDEIWIADKKNGVTELYSINDFKIHNTLSIENGYLEGRFGGVPLFKENV